MPFSDSITVLSLCHTPVAEPTLLLHVLPRGRGLCWQLSEEVGSAAGCWLGAPNSSNTGDSPTARNRSRSATTKWGDGETEGLCQPSGAWPGLGTACDRGVVTSISVQAAQLFPLVKLSPKGEKEKALVSNSNYVVPHG